MQTGGMKMEINLGRNLGGNIGAMSGAQGLETEGVGREPSDAAHGVRRAANLTVGKETDILVSAEPTSDISEASLRRDDDLGKLVNSAFCLQPPPMPDFGG